MTKEEIIERFKDKFQQYLIYVEKEVYCVDPDYDHEGMYACNDDGNIYTSPYDLYEAYVEDDLDEQDEEVKKFFEGFRELSEYDAWDKMEEHCKEYYDYISFGYYRLEHELKNICFTREEAIDLCKRYGNNAYYTSDRIKNDDIFYLKELFNKLIDL